MKNATLILLLISLLSFTMGSKAQDEATGNNAELSAEEKKKIEEFQKQQAAKETKAKPPKKVFKPSEEISEDRPVPFPVDI